MRRLVSVVVPTRNEEATIGMLLKDLNNVIARLPEYSFEVIVVDDGCTDNTASIANEYGARVVTNSVIHGKGKALSRGFVEVKGQYVVMMDGDYSHKPEDMHKMLLELDNGAGLVIGNRHSGGSGEYTLVRAFGNYALAFAFRVMFGVDISDPLNGYKAFRNIVAKKGYVSKDFEIEIEIISNALKENLDIVEVPSFERARAGGKMKSKAWIHGPKFLFAIIKHGLKHRFRK